MRALAVAACISLFVVLSGCAAVSGANSALREPRANAPDPGKFEAVNRWAREKHATVIWVHYPTRNVRTDRSD